MVANMTASMEVKRYCFIFMHDYDSERFFSMMREIEVTWLHPYKQQTF